MGSSRRTVLRHISLVWVAQILTMAIQLVYAGVTSRAIDPAGFGAFAVALAVTALGGMLADSGLASAAARRPTDDVEGDRAIVTAAAGTGLLVASAFAVSAPLWAHLWGNPEATTLIRVLSIGLAYGSYGQALAGIARRQGRMGVWTSANFASALTGMAVGGWVTYSTREPWSLAVMPVTTSTFLALLLLPAFGRRALPTRRVGGVGQDLIYGAKSLGSSLMTYVTYGLPTWAMSRWLGASTFGSWNRAVIVGQVPLESAARAVTTVIFPKFRWDSAGGEGVQRRWSALLASAAIVLLPLAALAIPAAPAITRILLGPQWTEAGLMAQWVLAATAVNVLNTLLGTMLQASNNFRAVWLSQVTTLTVMVVALVAILASGGWRPMAVGVAVAASLTHLTQLLFASRSGLVDLRSIGMWYGGTGGLCLPLALVSWALTRTGDIPPNWAWGALLLTGSVFLGALYARRSRLPVMTLSSREPRQSPMS